MISRSSIFKIIIRNCARLTYCKKANTARQQWFIYNIFLKPNIFWKDVNYNSDIPNNDYANSVKKNRTVWIYWAQGIECAPLLVKQCVKSIESNIRGYDIKILSKDSVDLYVNMPDYIKEKYETKIITQAQYSDILRLSLLATYGGIWCDATCYMTSSIPSIIESSDFFIFKRTNLKEHISPIQGSSWFIISKYGNELTLKMRNFMYQYWKHHNVLLDYFIFHIILGLITREDLKCKAIYDSIPYVCNAQAHVMQFSLSDVYTDEFWSFLESSCFLHKLTYKYNKSLETDNNYNILQRILFNNKNFR